MDTYSFIGLSANSIINKKWFVVYGHPLHKHLSNPNSFSSMKDFNADWQRAAASVLVAIGLHMPDLVSPFISGRLVD